MKNKKTIFIITVLLVLGVACAHAEPNGKPKKRILINTVFTSDGFVINTSYDEDTEVLSVEAEETVERDLDACWIDVIICKDGLEMECASFNTFTRQLRFDLSDHGAGIYEIYTVSETDAQLIGFIELTND